MNTFSSPILKYSKVVEDFCVDADKSVNTTMEWN